MFMESSEANNKISFPGNFWLNSIKTYFFEKQYLCFPGNKVA